jgi:hypothetical protein
VTPFEQGRHDSAAPAKGGADIATFVERVKRERAVQGLPPTITDEGTLRLIAALVGRKGHR